MTFWPEWRDLAWKSAAHCSHGLLGRAGAEWATAMALCLKRDNVPLDRAYLCARAPLTGDESHSGRMKRCLRTALQTELAENSADM